MNRNQRNVVSADIAGSSSGYSSSVITPRDGSFPFSGVEEGKVSGDENNVSISSHTSDEDAANLSDELLNSSREERVEYCKDLLRRCFQTTTSTDNLTTTIDNIDKITPNQTSTLLISSQRQLSEISKLIKEIEVAEECLS